jgi:hypothetical protein
VATHEESITKMVEAKFQQAYALKIQEFKDTFNTIKSWKEKFSSKEELEAELSKIGNSLMKPPQIIEEQNRKRRMETEEERRKQVP